MLKIVPGSKVYLRIVVLKNRRTHQQLSLKLILAELEVIIYTVEYNDDTYYVAAFSKNLFGLR
jgi:hypothetical protein